MRALIHDNLVVAVANQDFPAAPPAWWADCPDGTEIHSVWNGSAFLPPVRATPSLEEVKAGKRIQIAMDRDAACFADVTVLGHPWQADSRSQQMLASAILLAQAGVYTPSVWRDANNVDVPIANVGQLVAIAGAMAVQTQAAYATSWARKQALADAVTVEQAESA